MTTVLETTKIPTMIMTATVMWMSCCRTQILKILIVIHKTVIRMVSQTSLKSLRVRILIIQIRMGMVLSMERMTSHWIQTLVVIMMETVSQMK